MVTAEELYRDLVKLVIKMVDDGQDMIECACTSDETSAAYQRLKDVEILTDFLEEIARKNGIHIEEEVEEFREYE